MNAIVIINANILSKLHLLTFLEISMILIHPFYVQLPFILLIMLQVFFETTFVSSTLVPKWFTEETGYRWLYFHAFGLKRVIFFFVYHHVSVVKQKNEHEGIGGKFSKLRLRFIIKNVSIANSLNHTIYKLGYYANEI